ncbi:MAG: tetratricopeptide repeat protein [Acidobacteria bacterium]|nr:tetratricopeptide repeat protein [Acidobacteriota bacterium]MCA1639644.1 tetratricopeptide repeat protein [Acidobacteriota bacterium]
MKSIKFIFIVISILFGIKSVYAQNNPPAPRPASPSVETDPKLADIISKNLVQLQQKTEIPREKREQAYAKLLEGQRYIWSMTSRQRSQASMTTNLRLAREALQAAVEFDPTLAEAYTALADLTRRTSRNIDEAILLASIAVKIEPNNFGGHQILAQLYTSKSQLNRGVLDPNFTQKAINEWKEVARLDPRNAEAFAFLSEFYAKTNKSAERIDALRNWLASAMPLNNGFYGIVFQGESLAPESASVKLGDALIRIGQTRQAVEILSRAIADDPENNETIELLSEALETVDTSSAATVVQALQQAVYANPSNSTLIVLLAQVQARSGKINDAAKIISDATAKLVDKDKISAANLQTALGDIYFEANRYDEAVAVYQNALAVRGIVENKPVLDEERDFAIRIFDKMIDVYKKANRLNDAKAVIERARILLGKNDLFADKKLISFYRETGKKEEALQAIRALRARNADDYGLLRLEASILTDNGKVEEAVRLVKSLINKKSTAAKEPIKVDETGTFTISTQMDDDLSNYLFISNLYSQAKFDKEAIGAANQAYSVADSEEKKQIAKLTLATAQQRSGDFKSAEETLRGVLKQSSRNPIALNNLGYYLVERNEKLNEALDLIQQALSIEPNNPSYLDSLGWAYFKLGKLDNAEKYLKMALRFDASSATAYEHLGDVYQKQAKIELANSAWQKALNLSFGTEEINRLKLKLKK